jgi:thiamine pyrophosphokinase
MIALFLNGQPPQAANLPDLSKYSKIYCADGAYNYLQRLGIKPDYICGDFDSIESESPSAKRLHLPDQNFSDFEKTLALIEKTEVSKNVDVFGASGKEMDHFLGNLSVAKSFLGKLKLTFYDEFQSYFLSSESCSFSATRGKTISILPFPKAEGITLSGLKYSAENATFELGSALGIRNAAAEETVSIKLNSGCVAIFKEHDEKN